MKNFSLFLAFLFISNFNFSQQLSVKEILQTAENQKNKLQSRDADVYVIDSILCSQFNDVAQEFLPTTRSYNLEFDLETGLVLETLNQNYDVDQMVWKNELLETRTYNEDDELTIQMTEAWDENQQIWVNNSHLEIFFNAQGQTEKTLLQVWEDNAWQNATQTLFEYDNDGDNDQFEVQVWDADNNAWRGQNLIFQAFNGDNQLTATLVQFWDITENIYVNANQSFFTYDGDLQTQTLVKVWNATAQDFEDANRTTFFHDGDGNITEEINELWNSGTEVWTNNGRIIREYSSEGYLTSEITQNWANDQWNNQWDNRREYDADGNIQTFKFYLWQNDDWVHLSQCDFYGRVLIEDSVSEVENLINCRFPNPMPIGGNLACEIDNLKDLEMVLFDLNGRELFRKGIDNEASVNFDWDIQKGFYFFTIQNSSNVLFIEKLIVN